MTLLRTLLATHHAMRAADEDLIAERSCKCRSNNPSKEAADLFDRAAGMDTHVSIAGRVGERVGDEAGGIFHEGSRRDTDRRVEQAGSDASALYRSDNDRQHPSGRQRPAEEAQRTSKSIFERLRDEHGFTGSVTIVQFYMAGWQQPGLRCSWRWRIRSHSPSARAERKARLPRPIIVISLRGSMSSTSTSLLPSTSRPSPTQVSPSYPFPMPCQRNTTAHSEGEPA